MEEELDRNTEDSDVRGVGHNELCCVHAYLIYLIINRT